MASEGNAEQTGHRALGWSQSGRIRGFVPLPISAQPGSVCHLPLFMRPQVSGCTDPFLKHKGLLFRTAHAHPLGVWVTSQMTMSQRNPSESLFSYTFYSLIGTILK